MKRNSQNKLHMKKRQIRLSYVSDTTMNEHITNVNHMAADLLNLEVTFEDKHLMLMLLGRFPESLSSFKLLYFVEILK